MIKHLTLQYQYKHAKFNLSYHWQVDKINPKASNLFAGIAHVKPSAHQRLQAYSKTPLLLLLDLHFSLDFIMWPCLPNSHFDHVSNCGKLAFHKRTWKLSLIRAGAEREDCLLWTYIEKENSLCTNIWAVKHLFHYSDYCHLRLSARPLLWLACLHCSSPQLRICGPLWSLSHFLTPPRRQFSHFCCSMQQK